MSPFGIAAAPLHRLFGGRGDHDLQAAACPEKRQKALDSSGVRRFHDQDQAMLAVDERLRLDGHAVPGGVGRGEPGQQPRTPTRGSRAFLLAMSVLDDKQRHQPHAALPGARSPRTKVDKPGGQSQPAASSGRPVSRPGGLCRPPIRPGARWATPGTPTHCWPGCGGRLSARPANTEPDPTKA